METKKEFAKRIAKSINYADLFESAENIKIETLWKIYSQNIFEGIEVSATQYSETKQSFFVGFSECFRLMTDVSDKFSEDKACEVLTMLSKESNRYIESLIDRRFT